jgi:hypothetical protein
MDPRAQSRLDMATLIAIVAVGTAVRLAFLFRPMQLDEAYTYNEYASKPLLDGLSWYTLPNNHLLNTLLIHGATVVLGNEPWVVRLGALAAGLGLIPATYALTKRLCGSLEGLLAAALVAASEPLIDYSTNARGYTLVALVTVLLAVTAERILSDGRGGKLWDWVAFTILPALGCFAIPIMLYPYGAIVLWLVLNRRARFQEGAAPSEPIPVPARTEPRPPRIRQSGLERRGPAPVRLDRLVLSGVAAGLLTVVFYLPALIRMGWSQVAANPYVAPQAAGNVVRGVAESLRLAWLQWNGDVPRAVALGFVLAWCASLARFLLRRGGCAGPTRLLATVLGFGALAALVQRVVPYDRVWLFALPLYLACIAEGLAAAIARLRLPAPLRAGLALVLAIGLALGVVRGESLASRAWGTLHHGAAIAALLKPILRSDDGVVALTPCDAPLKYEFLRQQIPVEYLYDYQLARARRLFVAVDRVHQQEINGVLAGWKIPSDRFTPARVVRDFGDTVLYELRRRSGLESGDRSLSKTPVSFTMVGPWCDGAGARCDAGLPSSRPGFLEAGPKRLQDSVEPSATDDRSSDSGRLVRGTGSRRQLVPCNHSGGSSSPPVRRTGLLACPWGNSSPGCGPFAPVSFLSLFWTRRPCQ